MSGSLIQFINCKILRDHVFQEEDLWVRNGKVVNPEKIFFDERIKADIRIDCNGAFIAPGFIDVQINGNMRYFFNDFFLLSIFNFNPGGFGFDFSNNIEDLERGVMAVSKGILSYGVTAFCPTIVTSPKDYYRVILSKAAKRRGDENGASVLGLHLEGPFIAPGKKGAHPEQYICTFENGYSSLEKMYPNLTNVSMITLAPELDSAYEVIKELRKKGIVISLGHSMADLKCGESAVQSGATFITHLFNAMLPVSYLVFFFI